MTTLSMTKEREGDRTTVYYKFENVIGMTQEKEGDRRKNANCEFEERRVTTVSMTEEREADRRMCQQ